MTEDEALRQRCTRFLSHHIPRSPADTLAALARHRAAALPADHYGAGGAVAELEARTAALLGKPAARFFVKGMIAQMSVLRHHAETRRTRAVAVHPLSHIDHDEAGAVERLHGMTLLRLGRHNPFTPAELAAVTEPLAAVVVELPLRRAGYLLPPLDDLRAISRWCRAEGVPLHLDGARLWEAAAGYGIPLAELAALGDSVYVSFYKGLGGLGGAIVAGDEPFVASLDIWKTRHGGNLYTAYPLAVSALEGIETRLGRMPEFVDRARALAAEMARRGLRTHPRMPDVNAFQIVLEGSPAEWQERHRAFAAARGVWLFSLFLEGAIEGQSIAEIVIGDASDGWTAGEAAGWIADFAG